MKIHRHYISKLNMYINPPIFLLNAEGFGIWDNSSCRVLHETEVEVMCGCDHLTHFAILLVSAVNGTTIPIYL